MKKAARALAAALAGALLLGPVPAAAAAEDGTPKEEVVYIKLNSDGTPASVDVVNIFSLSAPGQIVDHGAYTAVRNMTTTDPLDFDGETVTLSAGAGRLYYEGHLEGAPIPWTFSLRYLLDGKEISAWDLAGKSGDLEMRLAIREDPSCRGNFFDTHALQVSFTLDTGRCRGIQAEGATVANVGGDKQLTFTVLPGQGADILVRALVTDFEMDAIAVNGVPLSLDVEVDDQALLDKVTALTEAVAALDDGAGELSGGTEELATGAESLNAGTGAVSAGAAQLQSGASALQSGLAGLQSGAGQLQSGLGSLSDQSSALTAGSGQVLTGLQTLQQELADTGLTGSEDVSKLTEASTAIKNGIDKLAGGITSLNSNTEFLKSFLESYKNYADGLNSAAAALREAGTESGVSGEGWDAAVGQLDELQGTRAGLDLYYSAVMAGLAGTGDLLTGVTDLQTNYAAFDEQIQALAGLLADPAEMIGQLKAAVDALTAGAGDLDAGIRAYTAGVAQLYAGAGDLTSGAAAAAGGAASLSSGAGDLASGAAELSGGAAALAEGATALDQGAAELKEGTAAMRQETDGMDGKIQDSVNGLLDAVTGGGSGRIVSYVSSRNKSVQAVQFVIQFPAIQKSAPAETEDPPAEELTFWDRLTALF